MVTSWNCICKNIITTLPINDIMNSYSTRRILCPDVPAGMTNTGTRWTKKQRKKSGRPARAVEVRTRTTTSSTERGVVVNVNIHSSYRELVTTNPGGKNCLRDK